MAVVAPKTVPRIQTETLSETVKLSPPKELAPSPPQPKTLKQLLETVSGKKIALYKTDVTQLALPSQNALQGRLEHLKEILGDHDAGAEADQIKLGHRLYVTSKVPQNLEQSQAFLNTIGSNHSHIVVTLGSCEGESKPWWSLCKSGYQLSDGGKIQRRGASQVYPKGATRIVVRSFLVKKAVEKHVTQIHCEEWPAEGPAPPLFNALLNLVDQKEPGPIMVQCDTENGPGAFIAADSLSNQIADQLNAKTPETAIQVNVEEQILQMRLQRAKMVLTAGELQLIYQSLAARFNGRWKKNVRMTKSLVGWGWSWFAPKPKQV